MQLWNLLFLFILCYLSNRVIKVLIRESVRMPTVINVHTSNESSQNWWAVGMRSLKHLTEVE